MQKRAWLLSAQASDPTKWTYPCNQLPDQEAEHSRSLQCAIQVITGFPQGGHYPDSITVDSFSLF